MTPGRTRQNARWPCSDFYDAGAPLNRTPDFKSTEIRSALQGRQEDAARRVEPRLFAQRSAPTAEAPLKAAIKSRFAQYVPPIAAIARLHPTRTKLTPHAAPENSFSGPFFSTIILHLCLVTLLIWQSQHHDFLGHAQGDLPDEVEVTFDTPMQGAMQGPQNNSDAGAQRAGLPSQGKPARHSEDLQDEVARDAASGSATPQPMSPLSPPDESGERARPATTDAAIPTDAPHPTPPLPPRHAQRRRSVPKSRNPFENMATLDYNDASPSPRRRTGRYGGAHGPVDMSYGPLVKNGTVNSPNLSVRKIRGVSEDYGEELSRWIRSRLFYPADAVANGEEGESSLHVVLDRQGRVKSVRVTGQSGSYALDAAAMSIFSMHAQLPPIPPDMVGDHFDIDMTINYILIRG